MIKKIFLLSIILLILPFSVSALTFGNFTNNGTGSINNANGYFDDPQSFFGYTGNRNVYAVIEDTEIIILEPITQVTGTTNNVIAINSSFGTLKDAVVNNGYLYFVDGTTLKKKKTRAIQSPQSCESNDTSAGGCIITIATGVDDTLRSYNNVLYYAKGLRDGVGTASLWHLDVNDNSVSDFTFTVTPASVGDLPSFAVINNGSTLTLYTTASAAVNACTSVSCIQFSPYPGMAVSTGTTFVTPTYVYAYVKGSVGIIERLLYISNGTSVTVDYITTDYAQDNRIYIGGQSTIGLFAYDVTTYQTFNSNEAGIDSLPLSEGSGIVDYVSKSIIVPNPTYFNDSIIPFNIDLKFVISATNHTNYQDSLFWHVKVDNPSGLEVFDLNLPAIKCTQADAWWDILSLFTAGDYTCDGSGTVYYSPSEGKFWDNGTWTVDLTEEIPGTISILSTDTWIITNTSANNTGSITQTPSTGGGLSGTSVSGTDITNMLSSKIFWTLVFIIGIMLMVSRKERTP